MITLSEINAAANKFQVSVETIEKDYVISWILHCLTKSKLKESFIFYGGTAIKRIYFEDHRFSEDIDLLSSQKFTQNYLLQELDVLKYAGDEANLLLEISKNDIILHKNRVQLFVRYSGYNEISGVPKEVRMDFAMDMDPYGKTSNQNIIASYSDLKIKNKTLCVMSLNTILANKLGMLIDSTRNEPRDLFDIWFLLQRIDKFNFKINEVTKAFYDKYTSRPSLNILKHGLRKQSLKINWEVRLRKQISELPNFEVVIKNISDKLEKLFG